MTYPSKRVRPCRHDAPTDPVSPARRVACHAVSECRRRASRMREYLRVSKQMSGLSPKDRALATRLAFGVTATSGALHAMLKAHLSRGRHLEPRLRDALSVAAFELCWLDTPTAVAVDQGVELVRCVAPHATGLANAILHRIAADNAFEIARATTRLRAYKKSYSFADDELTIPGAPLGQKTKAAELAFPTCLWDATLVSGMPLWLSSQLQRARGSAVLAHLALGHLEKAPVWVAANVALHKECEIARYMSELGLSPTPAELPLSWCLGVPAQLATSGLVQAAIVLPADLAAQVVARVAAPTAGQHLLEVGQGRGTKTALLQLAALTQGGPAELVAIDSDEKKVRIASKRMVSAGLSKHISSLALDGRLLERRCPAPVGERLFDIVFVDAPCSGTGTMRRHPEIPWSLDPDVLVASHQGSLPDLQLKLLAAASTRVRPGGTLIYATCSLLSQEDEEVVDAFLNSPQGAQFTLSSVLDAPGISMLPAAALRFVSKQVDQQGRFLSIPSIACPDGHFCARLVRA